MTLSISYSKKTKKWRKGCVGKVCMGVSVRRSKRQDVTAVQSEDFILDLYAEPDTAASCGKIYPGSLLAFSWYWGELACLSTNPSNQIRLPFLTKIGKKSI